MTSSYVAPRRHLSAASDLRRGVVAVTACLVVGIATSPAQGWLAPVGLDPLVNSPSGWTLPLVGIVVLARLRYRAAAVVGAAGFVAMVLGYTIASQLRDLAYDPVPWGLVGVAAGPLLGVAAAALRDARPRVSAAAGGLVAAVLLSDAVTGLVRVSSTTSPTWWLTCAVLGVLLTVRSAGRLGARDRTILVGAVVALVAAGQAAWTLLGVLMMREV